MLLGLASVSGQASAAPPGAGGAAEPPRLSTKPFTQLFTLRSEAELARKQLEIARTTLADVQSGSARRFICGMPVLEADPGIDPASVVPPPDTGTRFSMRTILPHCR